MIAGVAFDLYAGLFTASEASNILGLSGAVLATWGQRGFSQPTRREQGGASTAGTKRIKKNSPKGKPLFSARDLVKLRTLQIFSEQMGLPLTASAEFGERVKKTAESAAEAIAGMEATSVADTVAMRGEWMWAVARAFERGEKFHVYIYVTRPRERWEFDMHVGELGEPPCFGWQLPHIYLPASEIFVGIYAKCKAMLSQHEPGAEA
jgi:hypothetical protein